MALLNDVDCGSSSRRLSQHGKSVGRHPVDLHMVDFAGDSVVSDVTCHFA